LLKLLTVIWDMGLRSCLCSASISYAMLDVCAQRSRRFMATAPDKSRTLRQDTPPQCIRYENGALLLPVIATGVRISR